MPALLPSEEILKQIGKVLASWGYIEHQMKILLSDLLNIDFDKARLVYESFSSFESKVKLCHRLNNIITPYPEHKNGIKSILKKVTTLNDDRNVIAHALYGKDTNGTEFMFVNFLPNNPEKLNHGKNSQISPECLAALHERFGRVSGCFDELLNCVATSRQVSICG